MIREYLQKKIMYLNIIYKSYRFKVFDVWIERSYINDGKYINWILFNLNKLGISIDEFIIKKGSRFNSEIKDLSTLIRDNGIIGRGTLFLALGKPTTSNSSIIRLSLGEISKEQRDSLEYDFEEI